MKWLPAVVLCVAGIGGCQSNPPSRSGALMQIEILGFAGCPHTPEFRRRVEAAAERIGHARVRYVDQERLAEHDLRRGYPTPTALVDGRDLFGLPAPVSPAMGCRVYDGGLPTVDAIVARLRAMTPP
jgi:hypothetical protein